MGSVPKHPFFMKVIDALPRYDRSWLLPYITVMGSTGPLFLSVIWRHYKNEGHDMEDERVRVLFPDEYSKRPWSFFRYHVGNSWHQKDVQVILWVRSHPCSQTLTDHERCRDIGYSSPLWASSPPA
jgi:inositol phosphorylceramide mannosyltransferase catalytic subunit